MYTILLSSFNLTFPSNISYFIFFPVGLFLCAYNSYTCIIYTTNRFFHFHLSSRGDVARQVFSGMLFPDQAATTIKTLLFATDCLLKKTFWSNHPVSVSVWMQPYIKQGPFKAPHTKAAVAAWLLHLVSPSPLFHCLSLRLHCCLGVSPTESSVAYFWGNLSQIVLQLHVAFKWRGRFLLDVLSFSLQIHSDHNCSQPSSGDRLNKL